MSNGDVGIITDVETEDDDTIARVKLLDGRELSYTQEMLEDLEFSYCTTIHKSQGQEYPVIIVPLLKEHYIMLRRNLLYTAVTRAKAKVILIGRNKPYLLRSTNVMWVNGTPSSLIESWLTTTASSASE